MALKVREIVLKTDPSIREAIKWGNITFVAYGNLAWILNYDTTDYINFGFFKGTELSDPKKLLEGTGKGLRHVKIRSEKQIDAEQLAAWVKEAIQLNVEEKRSSIPKK
ncbi:MAG: DUF1801 domain-containing protein [Thaumarchaeota archaeon]|nr:DUF1801 domain-containing protein [Nitrososphaerota archaeon]